MGVVYKLKPEIKDFILKQKQAHPHKHFEMTERHVARLSSLFLLK